MSIERGQKRHLRDHSEGSALLNILTAGDNVYIVAYQPSTTEWFLVTCDMELFIESIVSLEVEKELSNSLLSHCRFTGYHWSQTGSIVIKGHTYVFPDTKESDEPSVLNNARCLEFFVNEKGIFLGDQVKFTASTHLFDLLPGMDGIQIVSHIQRGNKVYICGYDNHNEDNAPVFIVYDLETSSFKRLYYLYTDAGSITLKTISVDVDSVHVYVGGYVTDPVTGMVSLYIETFLGV